MEQIEYVYPVNEGWRAGALPAGDYKVVVRSGGAVVGMSETFTVESTERHDDGARA